MCSQIVLAVDTTGSHCAVCLMDGESASILAGKSVVPDPGHAEQLFEIISQVLAEAEISYSDITRIVAARGPGNFTGIRVGLAAARALGLGLNIPVIGVSNLESCAQLVGEAQGSKPVFCILDARNGNAYHQLFDGTDRHHPQISGYRDIANELAQSHYISLTICGTGAANLAIYLESQEIKYPVNVSHELSNAPIETTARLGAKMTTANMKVSALYLRQPDAKVQTGFAVPRTSAMAR